MQKSEPKLTYSSKPNHWALPKKAGHRGTLWANETVFGQNAGRIEFNAGQAETLCAPARASKPPRETNELAKYILDVTTGAQEKIEPPQKKSLRSGFEMHYNFVRIHKTLRCTPAMEAGVTKHLWEIEDVVALLDQPSS